MSNPGWAQETCTDLHLHHLPFAVRAEQPLVADNAVIIGALIPIEGDGILRQGDHLVWACIRHRRIIHCFVHSQVGSGRVAGTIWVHYC